MKRNPMVRMREMYDSLSSSEKHVAKCLLEEPALVTRYSIRELAEWLHASPSTIVRLGKSLGFNGYKEFKQAVVYTLASYENNGKEHLSDVSSEDSIEEIAKKVTYKNIQSLEETLNFLDVDVIGKCVQHLCTCRQVLLFGMGASLCVAKDASLKFLRVNKTCLVMDDWHSQYLLARNATEEDFAIIFSYSGETEEMIRCAEQLKLSGTPVLAITRYAESTLSEKADYILYTSAREALFRRGASSSRISQLNILDILYTAYVNTDYEAFLGHFNKTYIEKGSKNPYDAENINEKSLQ